MYLCVWCSALDRCSGTVVLANATRRRRYPRQNYGIWRSAATTTRRHSIRCRIVPPVTLLPRRLYLTTALSLTPARCRQSPANWSRRQPAPLTPRLSVIDNYQHTVGRKLLYMTTLTGISNPNIRFHTEGLRRDGDDGNTAVSAEIRR